MEDWRRTASSLTVLLEWAHAAREIIVNLETMMMGDGMNGMFREEAEKR